MGSLVIVEGPETAWQAALAALAADGWTLEAGFAPPHRQGRIARFGPVASPSDAEAALLAAIAGQGIVAHASADRLVVDRLADDLRRLGPVDHRVASTDPIPAIDDQVRELLGLLAEGHSLGEAATVLGLSRRTADRRLATARRQLGTDRTTEAIARAARLGWLRREDNTRR